MKMSYWRFAAMIATSTLVMFGLMYVHTYAWSHVYFSETRAWMALLMGAAMAVIMLGFMLNMYTSRIVNAGIFAGAVGVFALTTWLVRSQATVSGLDYMQAMVPHHSIAILTSERAGIKDPRVRKLADEIIEAQRKEIAEMSYLIAQLRRGTREESRPEAPAEEMGAGDAARQADLATTDLETLDEAELQRMLGEARPCSFGYAPDRAVVAAATAPGVDPPRGVIKLHGRIAVMEVSYNKGASGGFALSSDDVRVAVGPVGEGASGEVRPAEASLTIGRELAAGYAGYYRCTG